jgi:uncharacterized membrane protein YebE (DUF533 family)
MTAKRWVAQVMVLGLAAALTGMPESVAQDSTQSQPVTQKTDPAPAQQDPAPDSAAPNQTASPNPPSTAPDSPGAVKTQSEQGNSGSTTTVPPSPQTPSKPLGTAAAQPLTPSGVAASQPAGAAVAPAKQKRSRSLLIKVGAVVGAGVAVGTVLALSNATSSKPPGAH